MRQEARQIREAQARGEFDDLPGEGQPLDLVANPYAQDRDLKDSDYAPDWIELDPGYAPDAVRGRLERARVALARRWEWRNKGRLDALAGRSGSWAEVVQKRVQDDWRRALSDSEQEMDAINKEIAGLNLKVPGLRFQRSSVDASSAGSLCLRWRDVKWLTGMVR